jgi:small subunit ribosomal protein S7
MSRRYVPKKRYFYMDPLYQSILVNMIVNQLIYDGKKSLSYRLLYAAIYKIEAKTQRKPLSILEYAIRMVTPTVQLKARRVGGATYQVPIEVAPTRGTAIAIRWVVIAARTRPGRNMVDRFSSEILDASRGVGIAVRKREELHRMAEANKAFVRYRFLVHSFVVRS